MRKTLFTAALLAGALHTATAQAYQLDIRAAEKLLNFVGAETCRAINGEELADVTAYVMGFNGDLTTALKAQKAYTTLAETQRQNGLPDRHCQYQVKFGQEDVKLLQEIVSIVGQGHIVYRFERGQGSSAQTVGMLYQVDLKRLSDDIWHLTGLKRLQ